MSPFKLARLYRNPQPPLPHEGCPSWLAHEVTNTGSDRAQLANIASRAKDAIGVDKLEAVADRGYYSGEEILACDKAGIAVTLPKPMTSGLEARGRFGKQDFVYLGNEDVYRCPAGEKLATTTPTKRTGSGS